MVYIHVNIHSSQHFPIKWSKDTDSEESIHLKLLTSTKRKIVVKKYNTVRYDMSEMTDDGILFDRDFYYTFKVNVQDQAIFNIPLEIIQGRSCVAKANISKHQLLKDRVYGSTKVELLHPVTEENVGYLFFDYLVLPTEPNYQFNVIDKYRYEPKSEEFVYVGHRGNGSTKQRSLPILENTIASFIEAHNLGASFVELDVQLTKDLVPVVFHDDFAAILEEKDGSFNVQKIPVKDLSYDDICNKKIDFARPDAGLNYDHRFKGLFPTLEELLTQLPSSLGIFMEIKYPEPNQEINDPIQKDVFVDRVLEVMSHMTIRQPIMFCSFDPDICLMLKHKQSSFAVFLITVGENAFTTTNPWAPYDMRTRTRGIAANFAICHDLKGISINSDPLVNSKSDYMALTSYLMKHNKFLFSWGGANENGEYAELQKSVKVAGVISDKLTNMNIGIQRLS